MKKTNYQEMAQSYYDDALMSLTELIQINSVDDSKNKTAEAPFGAGVTKALDYVGKLGEKFGFEVDYCDHYCTEISYGSGDIVDIYAHLDVVPVGSSWVHPPFGAVIENGIMYGRGTSDDKGPLVASLYALKMLKDNNLLNGMRVRLVAGGNEELGSRCLEYYFHTLKKAYPVAGFTPDGDFPLIYAEKAIGSYQAIYKNIDPRILTLKGGVALNAVIDEAEALLDYEIKLIDLGVEKYQAAHPEIKISHLDNVVKVFGKAAHGSTPWCGINAGLHLINFLGELFDAPKLIEIYNMYLDSKGLAFGGNYVSEDFTETSYNIGRILLNAQHHLELHVNVRYPENVDPEMASNLILQKTHADDFIYGGCSEALYQDPLSPLVQTLLKAYQDETGDLTSKIKAIGGGTYAKESQNTIAFGSHFPGREDNIHDADEKIHLEDFYKSIAIYAHAIVSLKEALPEIKKGQN